MARSVDRYPIPESAEAVWRFFATYNELPWITNVYVKEHARGGWVTMAPDRGEQLEQLLPFDKENRTFRYRIVNLVNTGMPHVTGTYVGTLRILDDEPEVLCV